MNNLKFNNLLSSLFILFIIYFSPTELFATTYTTIAAGNWQSPNSWLNNNKPDADNLNGDTVYINHDIFLGGHDIVLSNFSLVVVTNCNLTTNNSTLIINDGRFTFDNGTLELRNGGQVELNLSTSFLEVSNAIMIVDDHYYITNGNNKMTNVCLQVGLSYVNTSGIDSLDNVRAEIGADLTGPFGGNMENNSSASMNFNACYIQINDGDFLNQSSSSVSGNIELMYILNGSLTNSASWTATINNYYVSSSTNVDPLYLPAGQVSTTVADSLVAAFSCPGSSSPAVTTFSVGSGLWSSASTWSNGIPSSDDNVIIDHAIDLDNDFTSSAAARIEINNGGSLDVLAGFELTLEGDFVNNGLASGKIIAAGACRTLELGALEQIHINTIDSISLGSNTAIASHLSLDQGELITNGFELRLESNSSNTAMIIDNGGELIGDVTVERFVQNNLGSHFFSPAVSNATVSELSDDITITLGSSLSTIYYYDETDDAPYHTAGWTSPSATSDPLEVGKGYSLYFDATNAKVLDVTGTANTGDQQLSLKYTESDTSQGTGTSQTCPPEGWNLVGNPYPSPLDFDLVAAANTSVIENSMYLWDPGTASYRSYVDGISVPSNTNKHIASSQGFWVKAKADNTILNLNNSMRVTDPNQDPVFYRTTNTSNLPFVRLAIADQNQSVESVFRLHQDASAGIDEELDAYYLPTDHPLNINFSSLVGTITQSVNSQAPPADGESRIIPIYSKFPSIGVYQVQMLEYLNPSNDIDIILVDKLTGIQHYITDNDYSFSVTNLAETDRFELHFKSNVVISSTQLEEQLETSLKVYKSAGNILQLEMARPNDQAEQLRIYNQQGQLLKTVVLAAGQKTYSIPLDMQATAIYYAQIGNQSYKFFW